MANTGKKPYLSIVVAGRNDNYGGDFNLRLQRSSRGLSQLCKENSLPAELIVVNYNPVSGNESLQSAISWPEPNPYFRLRIITVPESIHQRFHKPEIRKPVPLYEYIAKNTGIRRAEGEFILSANPDIIFHPRIIRFIASGKLQKDTYYRVDRCDFHGFDWKEEDGTSEILNQIRKNIFRVFLRQYRYELDPGSWNMFSLLMLRIRNRLRIRRDIWIRQHEKLANRYGWDIIYDDITLYHHTHCSGDFMLMHRDHWAALQSHPENTYLSLHTDSIFVIMVASHGLKEHVFRWPVYHQDHGRRYDAAAESDNPDFRKMFRQLIDDGGIMKQNGRPIIYNEEEWGCRDDRLEEWEM